MSDDSPILGLPFILPAQAQKHVTHNEALVMLDVFVQAVARSRSLQTPPVPIEAEVYIVASGAVGDWAGHDGDVAFVQDGQWRFFVPRDGWTFRVLDADETVAFGASGWRPIVSDTAFYEQLGIGAAADGTNRLAVASDAVLLTHDGAGHQLKLNKAAAGDTASLLFQTNFAGHAEMGLAGNNDFSIKVSADGNAFATALQANAATGMVSLPAGASIAGEVTGTAVTQSHDDTTAGRLLKVGDFGLGANNQAAPLVADLDAHRIGGQFAYAAGATGSPDGGAGSFTHILRADDGQAGSQMQLAFAASGAVFTRMLGAGSWGAWFQITHQGTLVGPVSQSGGVPTGATMERGSNGNGSYVRFADGTQICRRVADVDVNSVAVQEFAFPANFAGGNAEIAVSSGNLTATPNDALQPANLRGVAANGTNWEIRLAAAGISTAPATAEEQLALTAIGRWY